MPAADPNGASRRRLPRRLRALAVPVAALLALLALALTAGALAGVPEATLRTVGKLVLSPLWFLLPFLVLTALVGPIARLLRRFGPVPPVAAAAAVVVAADLGYGFLPTTLIAAWSVPFVLGVALAQGRLAGRRTGWALLAGGALAVVALVLLADYPASAVGVPGAGRSNLDPPSLAALALAFAQTGAVLLTLPWLRRIGTWRPVRALNAAALPVYLWHQATMISVTVVVAWLGGRLPGLLAAPEGYAWAAARFAWLPLFAAALVLVVRLATMAPDRRQDGKTPGPVPARRADAGRPLGAATFAFVARLTAILPGLRTPARRLRRPAASTAGAAEGPAAGRSRRPYRTVPGQPSGLWHGDAGHRIESPMVRVPGRRVEVIAVRDSDPPSRSRAAVRSR